MTEAKKVNTNQGSLDLKNTLEVLKAFELLTEVLGEVLADGKLTLKDLKAAPKLLTNYKLFFDAVKDVKLVGKEIKDLDERELMLLGKELLVIIRQVKNAVSKK